ncbi:MAG: gamma-glutamylcyclotransferase [Litoreibacter sp.]
MIQSQLWLFGYGSLIWNPEFEYEEMRLARITGFARSFCMWSIHHRGSEEDPGLVLALDAEEGAICDGVAFRIADDKAPEILEKVRERELISSAYFEDTCKVRLDDGRDVDAIVYIISPDHVQYCGDLTLEQQAQIIATASGGRGKNSDYLFNTAAHMVDLGIQDTDMMWLVSRVKTLMRTSATI